MQPQNFIWPLFSTLLASALIVSPLSAAQQVTGTPGSPSATTTIDGKQLPPPPDKHFGGKIERSVFESTPYWPPRVVPPKGAPNVLLIMTDDAGYGVSGTFGGVIPTPKWIDCQRMVCATPTSIPHLCARQRGRRSSPVATITMLARGSSRNCRTAIQATTA